MSDKEVYEIGSIINVEENYLNNIKYSVENLYNYNVRDREVYEDLMKRFANEMSTNASSIFLIFFTNVIDNDSMYVNDPRYQNIDGRLGISLFKDSNNNIHRINMKKSDLEYSYINTTIKTGKPYITSLNYYPILGKYMPMYTYSVPIFSKDDEMIGVSSLNVSLDSIIFYGDTNGFTISLFNEKGNIFYCSTDRYRVEDNITNLSDVYDSKDLLTTVQSNEVIFKESYNEESSSKFYHIFKPIHIFDDLYWGIELTVYGEAEFVSNSKIMITMWIIISAIIILIVIIVPMIINKKVVSVMNVLNDDIVRIKNGDISWKVSENYLKLNDEIGDMSRGINSTLKYLNDVIGTVKTKVNIVSSNSDKIYECVDKINDTNEDSNNATNAQFIDEATESSKFLSDEVKELKDIISYFKLRD